LQQGTDISGYALPSYDAGFLQQELSYFQQWYLTGYLQQTLSAEEQRSLNEVSTLLIDNMLAQPQGLVHRDYHSRNLMVLDDEQVGILDFQGMVYGPITYDVVSLLRDCYQDWPSEKVEQWALSYQRLAEKNGIFEPVDVDTFLRWFDWSGLQRHLKCLGLFARLHLRDNKSQYLAAMPRVLRYVCEVSSRYPELSHLNALLSAVEVME
jgi:aminoglycoside/choline kinase family phosphotransferase